MHLPARVSVDDEIELVMLDPVEHGRVFHRTVERAGTTTTRWLPHLAEVRTIDQAVTYLDDRAIWFEDGASAEWGVFVDGELAGMAWLVDIQEHNDAADIGYWLVPDARGRGVATRVSARLLELSFHELHLHRISIRCIAENVASRAIPERLGFTCEGTIRQAWKVGDAYVDHVVYGMLADEWHAR